MEGWVKIHRSLLAHPMWLTERFTRGQAWADMFMLANHKDSYIRVSGQRIDIKRGQLGWSQDKLAERWKWSRGAVSRFLKELVKDQMLLTQTLNRTTIITICNYEEYQSSETTDKPPNNAPNDQANKISNLAPESMTNLAADRQRNDTKQVTNKNVKNEDNEKNKLLDEQFEEFWNLYDLKRNKVEAKAAFKGALKKTEFEKMINAVGAYNNFCRVTNINKKYPQGWLNDERWDDDNSIKQGETKNEGFKQIIGQGARRSQSEQIKGAISRLNAKYSGQSIRDC